MHEEGTKELRRREFLGWLCKIGGGVTALTLGPGLLPLRRVNTVLFGGTAHAQEPCTKDVCTTRDACESGDAGHTCQVRDVCRVDESMDCTDDRCSDDDSGQCQGDQCGVDYSGACETDSCTVDKSAYCRSDACRDDKSGACLNDTCPHDLSGACTGDTCSDDSSGECISDRCTSDSSQACDGDVCLNDASQSCQNDRCRPDTSGACKSDTCENDSSGQCQTDDCTTDKSGECMTDRCAVDKSGACAGDTCTVSDSSGSCQTDTCNGDSSSPCISDTCDTDARRCDTDTTCPFDGTCFMDGFCPLDEGCFLDGVFSRNKSSKGHGRLANAAVKWLYKIVTLLLFLPFLTLPGHADAAVYDVAAGDTAGLIAAVESANANPNADIINLAAGDYVLTGPYLDEYGNYSIAGLPSVISPITINGSQTGTTTVRRSPTAGEDFSVFHVMKTDVEVSEGNWEERVGNLTLNRLVIQGGKSPWGAGVFNQGAALTVTHCTIRDNTAEDGGGGIENLGGTLTITDSTISGNSATAYSVAAGGGIENIGGQVSIRNSTIHGNTVSSGLAAAGGGMSGGAQSIINVTIAGNQVTSGGWAIGGGLFFPGGLKNSIVTQNTADIGPDVFVTTSQGYNIIKEAAADSFFEIGTSDLINTDPGLGAYTDSGAPGWGYLPVLAGSPAIDSADPASCTSEDQLGYPRVNTGERGAVEYRAGPHIFVTPGSLPFGNVTRGTSSNNSVTLRNIGTDALSIGMIAQTNPLSAPFSIITDPCSGQVLAPGGQCIITVRFAPTATGTFRDSFDIPSDDPDENPVTVAVSGTGVISQTYTVTYDGNGNTGGSVPVDGSSPYIQGVTVTVLGNTGSLEKTGFLFSGWNTAADGSGTSYTASATFAMPASDVVLHAQWVDANPAAIPALSKWGMILFTLLMATAAVVFMKKRKNTAAQHERGSPS